MCVCVSGANGAARWGQSGNELSAEVKKSANQPCRGTLVLRSVYSDQFTQRKMMCVLIIMDKRVFSLSNCPEVASRQGVWHLSQRFSVHFTNAVKKNSFLQKEKLLSAENQKKNTPFYTSEYDSGFFAFPFPDAFFRISYFRERRCRQIVRGDVLLRLSRNSV